MNNGANQSLSDIIISIAKSVAQAQSDVEESQLSHLFTFFERKFKKMKKEKLQMSYYQGFSQKSLKLEFLILIQKFLEQNIIVFLISIFYLLHLFT